MPTVLDASATMPHGWNDPAMMHAGRFPFKSTNSSDLLGVGDGADRGHSARLDQMGADVVRKRIEVRRP